MAAANPWGLVFQAAGSRRQRATRKTAPLAIPVLSIDAAEGCGAALVTPKAPPSNLPRLARVWTWKHSSYERWMWRCVAVMREAVALCAELDLPTPLVAVEVTSGASRYDKNNPEQPMMQGLGRRQGLAVAAWAVVRTMPDPAAPAAPLPRRTRVARLVRQSWWVDVLDLPAGKTDGGSHRLDEAATHLDGAATHLSSLSSPLNIDAAESALMGAAVSLHGGVP